MRFATAEPLGEARNEPFDLGLTLEAFGQTHPDHLPRVLENPALEGWRPELEYGPPIPAEIRFERMLAAHRERMPTSWPCPMSVMNQAQPVSSRIN